MGTLVLNGATSGSTTLTPTDATTQTITFPSGSGTVLTTASRGTGSVIQVVQGTTSSGTTTSSSSFQLTNLSVAITPTSSTSKILVFVCGGDIDTQATGRQPYLGLGRNGSVIVTLTNAYGDGARVIAPVSMGWLDSPATTSATTYAVYVKSVTSNTVGFNTQGSSATITAMEIAA